MHTMSTPPMASSTASSASPPSDPPRTIPQFTLIDPYPRLSMDAPSRLAFGSLSSSIVGMFLGALHGGQTSQLRFRAEHAHKMPDSTAGWYLYHKTKNYHAMYGGVREGMRMAARMGGWTFVALGLETAVDRCRGSADMFSTVMGCVSVAGLFSMRSKSRYSLQVSRLMKKMGWVGVPWPGRRTRGCCLGWSTGDCRMRLRS